ncbi:MAG TPA: lysine biosynthesis protein LysX [Candidatus Dormibacteraeota bacterium]|nr:lysine biosynthesis protein LysX [Candidatus Dormibacteraeota bacterium]
MRHTKVGLVCSRVRVEEKMLIDAFASRPGVEVVRVDDDLLDAPLSGAAAPHGAAAQLKGCDVVLLRALGHFRQVALAQLVESWSLPVVNASHVIETCGDKVRTTLALTAAGVPSPSSRLAFTQEAALEAVEELGYPCVIKPPVGSWGRLVARVNDRDAAEAVLEHKDLLGGPLHRVIYLQAHVDKPGRDLRAFVLDGHTVAAIGRRSDHWVTNTARGARAEAVAVTPELADLCRAAASAVGGGALAIDLLEGGDGLLVNEVNATMEFRNSVEPTGVDIPGRLVEHTLRLLASST